VLHAPNHSSFSPLPGSPGAAVDGCPPRGLSATRLHITRLGSDHEAQLSALLCGFDRPARINRFGHPATDARVRGYATDTLARAAYIAGALDVSRLIGVAEVFAPRDGLPRWRSQLTQNGAGGASARPYSKLPRLGPSKQVSPLLRMVISRNNWPMRQFAQKAGARLDLCLDEVFADIVLPTTASLDISA
jgi:hypothetical protein